MNIKKITVLLLFLVAIIGIIAPVNATIGLISSENKDYTIESKEKTVKYKITWNANGGKIGSKKTMVTTVKKGSKIAKLLATPKRSGYIFSGWYTKKTGGKKISKNTKPTKSLTYYAQWTKSLGNDNSLIGGWIRNEMVYDSFKGTTSPKYFNYNFKKDGTFIFYRGGSVGLSSTGAQVSGKFTTSGGKLNLNGLTYTDPYSTKKWSDMVVEYSFYKENGSTILKIPKLYEKTYIGINEGASFKRLS